VETRNQQGSLTAAEGISVEKLHRRQQWAALRSSGSDALFPFSCVSVGNTEAQITDSYSTN
jgi:hypothetical protein